ncbi:hypothetical protein TNCV_2995571 [Trichonephila clavipes]|nr:hypothetical protein TNCV_2995571 [Trichonephila clavipes]
MQCHPYASTAKNDRYFLLKAPPDRKANATQRARHFLSETKRSISQTKTTRNRLHAGGCMIIYVNGFIPQSRNHAAQRKWVSQRRDWLRSDWSQVLFYR